MVKLQGRNVGGRATSLLQWAAATFAPVGWWTPSQWWIAGTTCAIAFVAIGEVGQTLPPASSNRVYAIEWWNFVTLVADSALIGLVVGSLVMPGGRRLAAAGQSGFAGVVAAIMLACPICSPLAIPLLGVGGALAFLRGDRGWIALASVIVLGVTLVIRLRAASSCALGVKPLPGASTHSTG